MSGVNGGYFQAFQFFEAGIIVCQIVDEEAAWLAKEIVVQVAAKQISTGCQNSNGTLRVPWKVKNLSLEPILGEIKTFSDS